MSKQVEQRIARMWDRVMDRMDAAPLKALTQQGFYTRTAFVNGFFYALAVMERERQIREKAGRDDR